MLQWAILILLAFPVGSVWAIDPLSGIPEKYQASIQRIRESREGHLPPRMMRLGDRAIQAYFEAGEPTTAADLQLVMQKVDATEFLPDLKVILKVPDPGPEVVEIREIVERATKSRYLSYAELNRVLDLYARDGSPHLLKFPFILRFPEAHGLSKEVLGNAFLHGACPIEIALKFKIADGYLSSPKQLARHDDSHIPMLLPDDRRLETSEKTSALIEHELIRIDLQETADRLEAGWMGFYRFHESFPISFKFVDRINQLHDPKLRQAILEHEIGSATFADKASDDRKAPALRRKMLARALSDLRSDDPDLKKETYRYLSKATWKGEIKRNPYRATVLRDLLAGVHDLDPENRRNALDGLLKLHGALSPEMTNAWLDAFGDVDHEVRDIAISYARKQLENAPAAALNKRDFKRLVQGILGRVSENSSSSASNVWYYLQSDPRTLEALRSLSPSLDRLQEVPAEFDEAVRLVASASSIENARCKSLLIEK